MTIKDIKVGDKLEIKTGTIFKFLSNFENSEKELNQTNADKFYYGSPTYNHVIKSIQKNIIYFEENDYSGLWPYCATFNELNKIGAFKNIKTTNIDTYKIGDKFKFNTELIPYAISNMGSYSPAIIYTDYKDFYEIKNLTKTKIAFNKLDFDKDLFIKIEDFKKYAVLENTLEIIKEKKIVGYKLLKDIPGLLAGAIFTFINDAWECQTKNDPYNFFDEDVKDINWFSPIYEDDIKVGDYVIELWSETPYKNIPFQVDKIDEYINYIRPDGEAKSFLHNFKKATEIEIKDYLEDKRTIRNLGSNNISLKWDGKDNLILKGDNNSLSLQELVKFYQYSLPCSLGDYNIEIADKNAKIFRVGCISQNNLVSLNEIKKVIDFCK